MVLMLSIKRIIVTVLLIVVPLLLIAPFVAKSIYCHQITANDWRRVLGPYDKAVECKNDTPYFLGVKALYWFIFGRGEK